MHGFGVRTEHYNRFLDDGVPVPVVEVITENFLGRGGRPRAVLDRVRRDAEVVLHGVSLSIGGTDPLDERYLGMLNDLVNELEPRVVSDHACFGGAHGFRGHDLWPLPFTEEVVAHVAARVSRVQDVLGRQIALENVSSYLRYKHSEMDEQTFMRELAERADCLLLLDVNNVFVNAHNHGFDARAFIDAMPKARVAQVHLAGHSRKATHLFDDHASEVSAAVWDLYRYALGRIGDVPTIIERDENVPDFEMLTAEAEEIRAIKNDVFGAREAA